MKKVLFGISLALVSCAPAAQVLTSAPATQVLTSVLPAKLEFDYISNIAPRQASERECTGVYYESGGRSVRIGINDKFNFEFSPQISGITIAPEASGDRVRMCAKAELKVVPETYIVQVKLLHNESVNALGNLKIQVLRDPKFINIGLRDADRLPIGGKLCVPVQYRSDNSSNYTAVAFNQIALTFKTNSRITATIENSDKALCFFAPADLLAGRYDFNVRGVVNGVGTSEDLRITVQ
jgi:hypothetical protein